jgi:hypothetical protein
MEDITNRLITQSSYMITSQTQDLLNSNIGDSDDGHNTIESGESNYILRFLFMTSSMILSSFVAVIFSMLIPTLTRGSRNISFSIKSITDKLGLTTPLSEIMLESITCISNYGPESITITEQKLAVLHYLKKNMSKYKDLFKLKEKNSTKYTFNEDTGEDDVITHAFYEINQTRPIYIDKKDKQFLRISNINNIFEREQSRGTTPTREKVSQTIIQSNNGLKSIHDFINKCLKEYQDDKKKNKMRYMYTYLGLNAQKKPVYEKHIFKPYASFDGLVGDVSRDIQQDFKFFTSKEGENWFKKRNLPYQLTHCYYGNPGTGKSIIACAVAQEHNLHIVRIRLSDIKDNQEFVKVIRNTEYNGDKLEYKEILYLFDEFDTQLSKIAEKSNDIDNININKFLKNKNTTNKKGTSKGIKDDNDISGLFDEIDDELNDETKKTITKHITEWKKSTWSSNDTSLSIGVVLEELNGINQMYGRKMIMITNKIDILKTIHRGAFVRPGRIDRMCELKNMTHQEIHELLNLMYNIDDTKNVDDDILKIEEYKYSPAHMVNICKISKTIDDFFVNLKKNSNELLH